MLVRNWIMQKQTQNTETYNEAADFRIQLSNIKPNKKKFRKKQRGIQSELPAFANLPD
jgi:hypothetical protein